MSAAIFVYTWTLSNVVQWFRTLHQICSQLNLSLFTELKASHVSYLVFHSLCTTYPQVHISHIHCSFSEAVGFGLGFGPNSSFGFFVCFVVVDVVVMSSLVVLSVSNDRSTTSIDSLCSFKSQTKSIFQMNTKKPEKKSSDFDFFSYIQTKFIFLV